LVYHDYPRMKVLLQTAGGLLLYNFELR